MDIQITEKITGSKLTLSMLPEATIRKGSAKFQSYDIISKGEVKLPRGTNLLSFSWSGIFPGASRKNMSFVKTHHWRDPKEMENIFEGWRKYGTVLNLMVTETSINHEVLLSDFTTTNSGSAGDVAYEVTFVENKNIFVYNTSQLSIMPTAATNDTNAARPEPAAAAATTYTVVSGDNLWNIAKQYLGSGVRYTEIYELNKSVIGSDPGLIYPGQVLTLPS